MKKSIKSTLVLVCICAAVSVLLAFTNALTAPIIEKQQSDAANAALLEIMPNGSGFEEIADLSTYTLPATVTKAWREASGGHVVQLTTTGYDSGFVILVGVNADGTVSGTKCLASTETLGYEKTFGESFTGKNAEEVAAVDTLAGATKTTAAYRGAVTDAINTAIILGGGSVDIRTEEEILNDNLAAALPAAEGKFTKLFIVEDITGIDAVYTADNGAGSVYLVGEEFIAVLTGETPANETVATAHAALAASSLTALDLSAFEGLPTAVLSASVTATGNYVMELRAAGYGIQGEWHASGEYIKLKVSMTADGRIIDCVTLSQKESEGIGDVCADPDFYGQFVGKTEATYGDVDTVSGATLTTGGYKTAIMRAFEAVKILKGGQSNE